MRQSTVEYVNDDYDVELVVREATTADAFRKGALARKFATELGINLGEAGGVKGIELMRVHVATRFLPECISATVEVKNRDKEKTQLKLDLTVDDFLALPEALVMLWQEAMYALNPHWFPKRADESGEAKQPEIDSG